MFEFTLILVAVAIVMATRWETSTRRQLRFGGLLAGALAMRVVALVTAAYVAPHFSSDLVADEPVNPPKQEAKLEVVAPDQKPADEKLPEKPGLENSSPVNASQQPGEDNDAHLKPAEVKPTEVKPTESTPAGREIPAASESKTEPSTATDAVTTSVTDTTKQSSDAAAPSSLGDSPALPKSRPTITTITNIRYLTPNRPAWVEAVADEDNNGNYVVAVKAGPYPALRDCQPDLDREVTLAVQEFINDHLRAPHAATFFPYTSLKSVRDRNIVREVFSEQIETSLGLMHQFHAQLVFDNSFRDELDQRWAELKTKARLTQSGLGAGIVLLFLGTLFSFLKIDTATKGYYTGRLQFGAAATILALVAASVVLAKWIPWM